MKKTISRILGVGVSVALLASLVVFAAPVSALTQPTVSLSNDLISHLADYTIMFDVSNDLAEGGTISVTFPVGTYITSITDAVDADVTIAATSGIGSSAFGATQAGSATVGQQLTITVPDVNVEDKIGAGATVQVVVSGVVNPPFPGYYTLTVHTSQEPTPVESDIYVITMPLHAPWPFVSIPTGQNIISQADADYPISIGLGEELGAGDTITVTFPSDTVVSAPTANITASIGWIGGIYKDATLNAVTWTADTATRTVTATLGTGDEVGELAWVWIEITAGITNPSFPGDYTLTVHTSQEPTPVQSNAYTITTPPDPSLPGIVQLYNPSDILMAQYTGDDAIQSAIDDAMVGYTVKVGLGTYKDNIELKDGVQVLGAGAGVTTIDGGGSGNVVTANNVDSAAKLDGFTITGGRNNGIYNNNNSSPTISNNTISGNFMYGIYNNNSSPTISNNIITDNVWGIYNNDSSPTITNNSITGNDGGIYNNDSSPTITNNIITGSSWYGIYNNNSLPTIDYNDVWGNWTNYVPALSAGSNDISEDPLFVGGGDYHLQPSSPAIDAGSNAAVPSWLTTDFEGDPRIWDGDGDGDAVVDMGADEYYVPPTTVAEATIDIDPDTLNLKSKGKWITAYIELPEGYDVAQIDIATVLLNGVVPAESDAKYGFVKDPESRIGDYDDDGIPDCMVKFDRSAVQGILGVGDEVEITVTGEVAGTPFEGSDIIRVK